MRSLPHFLVVFACLAAGAFAQAPELKLGIIGTDTSHVPAFTKLFNDPKDPQHIAGARVVAAVEAYSADIPKSIGLSPGYVATIRDTYGVTMVPTVEELCTKVDAVFIESLDGRPKLAQAKAVIAAKKPLFVDKPAGASLREGAELYRLAHTAGVPIFTCSAYRYYPTMVELKAAKVGELRGAISYGPAHLEEHHPDLFWYGIHPTEALYTMLGTGCESVSRVHTDETDVVTGQWSGGRTGVLYGLRTKPLPHKVVVFGTEAAAEQKTGGDGYAPLVAQILQFFRTGQPPVSPEETLELYAFMQAADLSKERGGAPVKLSEVWQLHGGKPW